MDKAMLWDITHGVKEDCEMLLDRFCRMESLRFKDFATAWRACMFSHIFSGRYQWNEIIDYVNGVLAIAVRLFIDADDLRRKVGALYMLYGMINKLPLETRRLVGLRVTRDEWQTVCDLKKDICAGCHHDAHYALVYLFQQGSFQFSATSEQLAPDLVRRRLGCSAAVDEDDTAVLLDEDGNRESAMTAQMDAGLRQLSALHQKYVTLKTTLFPGDRRDQLNMVANNIVPKLAKQLGVQPLAQDLEAENMQTESDEEEDQDDLGSVRQGIRAKALLRFRSSDETPAPSTGQLASASASVPGAGTNAKSGRGSRSKATR